MEHTPSFPLSQRFPSKILTLAEVSLQELPLPTPRSYLYPRISEEQEPPAHVPLGTLSFLRDWPLTCSHKTQNVGQERSSSVVTSTLSLPQTSCPTWAHPAQPLGGSGSRHAELPLWISLNAHQEVRGQKKGLRSTNCQ